MCIETAAGPVGEQLGQLKEEIYNFLPGTVKTDRGGAVTNTTRNWDNTTLCPKLSGPIPIMHTGLNV